MLIYFIQPYGLYFNYADCSIVPYKNYVQVTGMTEALLDAEEVSIKLTLLKEKGPGNCISVWSDSITNVLPTAIYDLSWAHTFE